ncbi:hypothetical protein [Mycolicibacterium mageritense]|uniref:hypothetical protein n=1 Tax=Mycolicibacterium mageritense TaxID=53462 RepID=UPI001E631C57|nr:hypothetical protein [Mycolicibacterium mageritense]GJJ22985.1 hypothetical protein MTY414_66580 [Mycolicibacterium mageritense]
MSTKIESKSDVRRKVREAQTLAQQERIQREADNREDMVAFLLAEQKLEAVDDWEKERRAQVAAEADQRRHEQRVAGAKALARIQARDESVKDIARLGGIAEKTVRSYLKLAKELQARNGGGTGPVESQPLGRTAGSDDLPSDAGSQALGLASAAEPDQPDESVAGTGE